MDNIEDIFWYDDETLNSVDRYEAMLRNQTRCFFDVHEFEDIIDYYLDSRNFTKAAIAAEHATSIYPTASSIKLRMAEILIDTSQPAKALNYLNKIGHLESDEIVVAHLLRGSALNMMGKPREAQRQFEKAVSLADEDKAAVLYNIGISFESINQHRVALKYFLKVHLMEPGNYYVYYDIAYCYERLEEFDKSIEYYLKFLDEDPFSEHVWYNLGIVYNKKDDNEKALEAYDYAIAIANDYSSAYFNKANTLSLLDRNLDAINTYFDFLDIEPENAAAHCYIGECYERLEVYDLAKIHYMKSLILDDQFADAWFGLGVMKSQDSNYKGAIKDILKALNLCEDNPEYLFALASTYNSAGKPEKSIDVFKKLIPMVKDDIQIWDCYAQVYAKQGNFVEARKIIAEALENNPDAALLHYRVAAYYLLNNEEQPGITTLEETLKKYPEEYECFFDVFETAEDDEIIAIVNKYRKP